MMDWNSTIENDGEALEYIVLPEGDYSFTVTKFEKSEHHGSAKIPPCKMALLELTIKTPRGVSVIRERLFLDDSFEWKLCQFFRSIGQRSHGQKYTMDWGKVNGARGRAHVIVNEWQGDDGVTHQNNRIQKYLDQPKGFEF